jgi:hypothetical protein
MDEEQWFVTNGEWRMGPLTRDDVVEVVGREHAPGSLFVWKEGFAAWTSAESLPDLAPRAGAPARPATPTSQSPADVPPTRWFLVGTGKFLLMCVATLGAYQIYWFFMQWRHVRGRGESVHPALRTVLAGLFCYALFRRVADDATERGIAGAPSPLAAAAAFILLSITWQLPQPWSFLSLLSLVPLVLVQRAASAVALAAVPTADPNTRLTPINWFGIAGLWLLVMLVGALLGPVPPAAPGPAPAVKPAPTVTSVQASVN